MYKSLPIVQAFLHKFTWNFAKGTKISILLCANLFSFPSTFCKCIVFNLDESPYASQMSKLGAINWASCIFNWQNCNDPTKIKLIRIDRYWLSAISVHGVSKDVFDSKLNCFSHWSNQFTTSRLLFARSLGYLFDWFASSKSTLSKMKPRSLLPLSFLNNNRKLEMCSWQQASNLSTAPKEAAINCG